MDAALIDDLASLDPSQPRGIPKVSGNKPGHIPARALKRFAVRYANPAFGWYIAQQFARHRKTIPAALIGKDYWLFRAFLMMLDSDRFFDEHVAEAYAISCLDELGPARAAINGMLLTGAHGVEDQKQFFESLSKTSGVSADTLECYEVCFFNILDRVKDALYIAAIVYPESRLVEFQEDYNKTASHKDILARAGYNHKDLKLAAYLAGVGDTSYMAKLAARPDREAELTKQFMGNAMVLAQANYLNQRITGLGRAQQLIAASRQGGSVEESAPVADVGSHISTQLQEALQINMKRVKQLHREDAGVVDVETLPVR